MACQEIVFPSFPTENKEWERNCCGCLTAALYLPIFTVSWPAGQGESHGETLNFLVDNKSPTQWRLLPSFLLTVVSPSISHSLSYSLKSHLPFSDSIAPVLFLIHQNIHEPHPSRKYSYNHQPLYKHTHNNHIKMSAIAKPVTILAGLLVAGTATTYTVRSKNSDFSAASLAASDMDAAASAAGVSKPKL
jgi:hypothetical protein